MDVVKIDPREAMELTISGGVLRVVYSFGSSVKVVDIKLLLDIEGAMQ